jgi:hypothetical protein
VVVDLEADHRIAEAAVNVANVLVLLLRLELARRAALNRLPGVRGRLEEFAKRPVDDRQFAGISANRDRLFLGAGHTAIDPLVIRAAAQVERIPGADLLKRVRNRLPRGLLRAVVLVAPFGWIDKESRPRSHRSIGGLRQRPQRWMRLDLRGAGR